MREGHERVVVDLRSCAAPLELRVDVRRPPEQNHRLVDQMAAEVEEQAARIVAAAPLAPGAGSSSRRKRSSRDSRRAGAPEAPSSRKRRSVRKSESHRRFWNTVNGTPAASAAATEPFAVGGGRRERLVHDHGEPRVDRREPERHVGAVHRGDHDEVVLPRQVPQLVRARHDPHAGVSIPGCLLPAGSLVTTDISSMVGSAATSGAWKTAPPNPYPIRATLRSPAHRHRSRRTFPARRIGSPSSIERRS